VICGVKVELSPMEAKKLLPKNSSEYGIPVTNNGRRNSMQMEGYLKEGLSNLRGCIGMLEGCKVPILGEMVNKHKDGSSAIGSRESIDEVHGNIRLNMLGNG
jgi:hypothetical protein